MTGENPTITTEENNEDQKLDIKKILPVFVIVLIDLLGLTIIIPLMPLYAASFGANAFVIGALGAAYPIMQFIGAPILGRLSDRFGRRPVLIVSQIGTFLGFLLLGFANSLVLLFISRIIDGISGANIATAQAVITDNTTEKNRTQGLGLIGAAFGLGFIIGPVIAFVSLAASGNNYHVPAFVAAAFSLISILLTYFWLEESHPPEKRGQNSNKSSFGFGAMFSALRRPQVGFLFNFDVLPAVCFWRFRAAALFVYPQPIGDERLQQFRIICLYWHYCGDGARLLCWKMELQIWRSMVDPDGVTRFGNWTDPVGGDPRGYCSLVFGS